MIADLACDATASDQQFRCGLLKAATATDQRIAGREVEIDDQFSESSKLNPAGGRCLRRGSGIGILPVDLMPIYGDAAGTDDGAGS